VVCEHVSTAERWILLNLLQLEIKRLNCSPTAPSSTMPERGLTLDRPDMVQAPSGKLRSMEARGLLPRDEACEACAGVDDSWDLGFSFALHSVAGSTLTAPQATAREVVYGTVDTVLRFQTRREDILSRLKQPLSYSKGFEQQRFGASDRSLGHASAALHISNQSHPQSSAVIQAAQAIQIYCSPLVSACAAVLCCAVLAMTLRYVLYRKYLNQYKSRIDKRRLSTRR
jgi:hypothetical protein